MEYRESMVGRSDRSRRRFRVTNDPIKIEKEVKYPQIKDDCCR